MKNEDAILLAAAVDRLVLECRPVRDLSLLAQTDRSDRVRSDAGGHSPNFTPALISWAAAHTAVASLPLTVDEVVLGRPPSRWKRCHPRSSTTR